MNQNLYEIAFVLDRSGSMDVMKEEAVSGLNCFIDDQKNFVKKNNKKSNFTLVFFDHQYELIHNGVDLESVKHISDEYEPRGMTALLDAVGRTIDDIGKRLSKTDEKNRPSKVVVAILTDGMENSSKDYTYEKLAAMIKEQREKYNWEFVFLGSNMDSFSVAQNLNINMNFVQNFNSNNAAGYRSAYQATSQMVSDSLGSGS